METNQNSMQLLEQLAEEQENDLDKLMNLNSEEESSHLSL
jgi:hypothetical protein